MNLPFTKTVSHLRSFSMRSFKHKIDLWNLMLSMFQKNIEVEDCSKATTSSAMIWGLAGDYIRLWTFLPKPNAISDSVSFFHDKNTNFPCMYNPFHNLWKHDTTKECFIWTHISWVLFMNLSWMTLALQIRTSQQDPVTLQCRELAVMDNMLPLNQEKNGHSCHTSSLLLVTQLTHQHSRHWIGSQAHQGQYNHIF